MATTPRLALWAAHGNGGSALVEKRTGLRGSLTLPTYSRANSGRREAPQGVQRVAADEQVLSRTGTADRTDGLQIVEEADLSDPVVRRRDPLITTVLMGEQPERLVRPRQLKATLVRTHREPFSSQSETHSAWRTFPSGYRAVKALARSLTHRHDADMVLGLNRGQGTLND